MEGSKNSLGIPNQWEGKTYLNLQIGCTEPTRGKRKIDYSPWNISGNHPQLGNTSGNSVFQVQWSCKVVCKMQFLSTGKFWSQETGPMTYWGQKNKMKLIWLQLIDTKRIIRIARGFSLQEEGIFSIPTPCSLGGFLAGCDMEHEHTTHIRQPQTFMSGSGPIEARTRQLGSHPVSTVEFCSAYHGLTLLPLPKDSASISCLWALSFLSLTCACSPVSY